MQHATSAEVPGATDSVAFERFFEAERRRLFRALYVMTLVSSPDVSPDLCQTPPGLDWQPVFP